MRTFRPILALATSALMLVGSISPAFASATTTAISGQAGSYTSVSQNGQQFREGATIANNTLVNVGTAALLTPGVGDREVRTSYNANVVYQAGTAVAPEGWTLYYSVNHGSTWTTTEPAQASSVTDIKAVGTNIAAGAISGTSQTYSTETTANVPSGTFGASSGGDGWGVTFYDNFVFNVYHHSDVTILDCHLISDGTRCDNANYPATITTSNGANYYAGARAYVAADAQSGRLYEFTGASGGSSPGIPGMLCIDVSTVTTPTQCGFTTLSSSATLSSWQDISEIAKVGNRLFGVSAPNSQSSVLYCFDISTQQACANNEIVLDSAGQTGPGRIVTWGNRVFVATDSGISCLNATTLVNCQGNWPATTTASYAYANGLQVHLDTSLSIDGVCDISACIGLDGSALNVTNPIADTNRYGNDLWFKSTIAGGRLYGTDRGGYGLSCFDYATSDWCPDFSSSGLGLGFTYQVVADPQNANCLWLNGDNGYIMNFDGITGERGCSANPVVTLQPSQFAPRYSCSTTNGITAWTTLKIATVNATQGTTYTGMFLTVRDPQGVAVPGWTNVRLTVGQNLSMASLDTALSGSRPTFSFAFTGVTGGTISTAVVALDYLGKGPELCSAVLLTGNVNSLPLAVAVNGSLVDNVGGAVTYDSVRNLTIAAANGTNQFQTVPSAPTNLVGSGLNTSATLTFTGSSDTGGVPLDGYLYSLDGGTTYLSPANLLDNGNGTYSIALTGLTSGATYPIRVVAVNSVGRSAAASLSLTVQLVSPVNIPDTAVDQGPIYLATVNGNNLPYTYAVSPANICTVTNNVVTLVGVGVCNVTANQAGDQTHIATSVSSSFSVLAAAVVRTAPGAVQNLTVVPGVGQATLNWAAPLTDGGAAITDYVIQYKVGTSYVPFNDGVSTNRSAVITGLTNGQAYYFRVSAVNSVGQGDYNTTQTSFTPASVPGSATALSATQPTGGTTSTISWTNPASNGGSVITGYEVSYKLSSDARYTVFSTASASPVTVTGLTRGATYDFQVVAINGVGRSVPTSTVNLVGVSGNGQLALTWVAPQTGTPIDYQVQYRITGTSNWTVVDTNSVALSYTLGQLSNGVTYEVRVAAMSDATTVSSYSSVILGYPWGAPSAPTLVATPANTQIGLNWNGADPNGSDVTDYTIQYRTVGSANWTSLNDGVSNNTFANIVGLTNGTVYEIRVAATNAAGLGAYSAVVTSTPRTIPDAPVSLGVLPGRGGADLTWNAPLQDGGSPVTNYKIQYREINSVLWVDGGTATGLVGSVYGLLGETTYAFRVAAGNAAGYGPYTSAVSVETLPAPNGKILPTVISIDKPETPVTGGDKVTITGVNLEGVSAVLVNGVEAKLVQTTATSFTFVAPAGELGDADVTFTTPFGTMTWVRPMRYISAPSVTPAPVAKTFTFNVGKFSTRALPLTPSQRAQIATALKDAGLTSWSSVTCVGAVSSKKAAAKTAVIVRANQVCSYVKTLIKVTGTATSSARKADGVAIVSGYVVVNVKP